MKTVAVDLNAKGLKFGSECSDYEFLETFKLAKWILFIHIQLWISSDQPRVDLLLGHHQRFEELDFSTNI